MAVLQPEDYRELRKNVYQAGKGKEELKALPNLPNNVQLFNAFQSLEDSFVASFAAFKSNMDTQLGVTTSSILAQKMMAGYLLWKINKLLGF